MNTANTGFYNYPYSGMLTEWLILYVVSFIRVFLMPTKHCVMAELMEVAGDRDDGGGR